MKRIKLYIATSLDGYIATSGGGVEWLDKYQSDAEDYGYAALYESVDTVLMGGNTYRSILGFGCEWPYAEKQSYVISRTEPPGTLPNVRIISDEIPAFLRRLKTNAGKDIWLVGGGELTSLLLAEGLVDEMQLCIFPQLLGTGIRLFPKNALGSEWRLVREQTFPTGAVMLVYQK